MSGVSHRRSGPQHRRRHARPPRKRLAAAVALLAVFAAAAGAGAWAATGGGGPPAPSAVARDGPAPAAGRPLASGPPVLPACSPARWPVARRVRQLLFVSAKFSDLAASRASAATGVGGFVLFGSPGSGSAADIRSGVAALDAAAARAGQTRPWMATDEEGGDVARLAGVIGDLPAPRILARTESPAQVQSLVESKARAMAGLGVTVDLAPVLDTAPATDTVASEDTRSFSDAPGVVAAYGQAFVSGLEAGGVVPTVKHFPGLGHANADTDVRRATDPPLAQLQRRDLLPFASAVDHGVPVVMVGHPIVPGLTGGQPASMSPAAYRYLRDRLGFTGVAVTDALDAGAIRQAGYTQATAAVRAVESGADMVLVDAPEAAAATAALEHAVASGKLPAATLDRAVGTVLAAKHADPCQAALPSGCAGASAVAPASAPDAVAAAADPARPGGYWVAYADGCVAAAGGAPLLGGLHHTPAAAVVGIAAAPGGRGYWLAGAGGQVYAVGAAAHLGSLPDAPAEPVSGIATTGGAGYWLAGAGGRVYAFGDASSFGSVRSPPSRVTGIAGAPGGRGYWVLGAGGQVAAFGDAAAAGAVPAGALPDVGITSAGHGYWTVAESGLVDPRGGAPFAGSGPSVPTASPAVAVVAAAAGGYDLVLADGRAVEFR